MKVSKTIIIYILFIIFLAHKSNILTNIRIVFFHILILLLTASLFLTSKTNPGTIPVYWGFHIGDEDFKKRRYCLICQVFKPERTHHCSICNLCILNMDHHCPWVDNCIGFYNKKFFIQLLFYFLLTSFSFCITYIPYSIEIIKTIFKTNEKENLNNIYKNILVLFNNIILLGFTVIDFNFLKFHIKLISSNLTTIETLDKELMENKKYDIGFEDNFKQVFGENKLLWFLPINLPIGYPNGDGLTWSTKEEIISLENLNINNENNNDNKKSFENNNNNISEKNVQKNNSLTVKTGLGATRASSLNEYPINNNGTFGNYSKYNSVKRNSGNYQSNSTRYESNSINSKIGNIKNNDILSI